VNSCTSIKSFYITDAETKLLNEINLKHSECAFGKEAFTSKDLVVKLEDVAEFYKFLDLCYKKLVLRKSNASDRCGFFRIGGESVVPYTVKEGVKYVPLFYFEGETDHLNLKSESVEGWDLAFLKFCCKVQGIRNELFSKDTCKVVALDDIKGNFPSEITFEDYWPAKGSIEPVSSRRPGVSAGNWTQKPAGHTSKSIQSSTQIQGLPLPSISQLSALNAAYRQPQQQLTAAQFHQQMSLQGLKAPQTGLQLQQLIRAGVVGQQQVRPPAGQLAGHPGAYRQLQTVDMSSQGPGNTNTKTFPGKLTQIKMFPVEKSNQPAYKLQKALIDQKIVPCINVRPFVFHDLMMTLPDFVQYFFPDLPLDKSREMLQEILNVVLYKGNAGHQEVLKQEGKCYLYDPVPLVLVKDIMTYMPQIKYMFSNTTSEPTTKKQRVN